MIKLPAWHAHPDVWLLFGSILAAYFIAARRHQRDTGEVTPRRTERFFVLGIAVLWLGADWPIHDLAERYLFSMHMVQHMLFTLVAAPLLLAGVPAWMWQALLRVQGIMPVARRLTNPVFAFAQFNAILLMTHLPFAVNYALSHHWFHLQVHALLMVSALLMWWPILSTVPALPRLAAPLQMAYLFGQSLLPTVIAAFVTFADGAIYPFYEKAPRIWGLTAETDQQIGGGVMKIMGSLILWGFIAWIFFDWYARDEKASREPRWDEVSEELDRLGLTSPPRR